MSWAGTGAVTATRLGPGTAAAPPATSAAAERAEPKFEKICAGLRLVSAPLQPETGKISSSWAGAGATLATRLGPGTSVATPATSAAAARTEPKFEKICAGLRLVPATLQTGNSIRTSAWAGTGAVTGARAGDRSAGAWAGASSRMAAAKASRSSSSWSPGPPRLTSKLEYNIP